MATQDNPKTGEQNKEEQTDGTGRNKRRNQHGKNSKHTNHFKGETPGMQGRVFRLQSE